MHWTLAILNLLFLQSTYGINVGVGISDITGPAAEIGMVSAQNLKDLTILRKSNCFKLFKKLGLCLEFDNCQAFYKSSSSII